MAQIGPFSEVQIFLVSCITSLKNIKILKSGGVLENSGNMHQERHSCLQNLQESERILNYTKQSTGILQNLVKPQELHRITGIK